MHSRFEGVCMSEAGLGIYSLYRYNIYIIQKHLWQSEGFNVRQPRASVCSRAFFIIIIMGPLSLSGVKFWRWRGGGGMSNACTYIKIFKALMKFPDASYLIVSPGCRWVRTVDPEVIVTVMFFSMKRIMSLVTPSCLRSPNETHHQ